MAYQNACFACHCRARDDAFCSSVLSASFPGVQVGVRLTPGGTFNATKDMAEAATGNHEYFCKELNGLDIAYLHVKLADDQDERHGGKVVPIE